MKSDQAAQGSRFVPWAVGAVWITAFAWGWNVRDERYVSAEFGLGYGLGIAGLACMSIMLLYSVRKRMTALRQLGPVRRWLSVHMLLGLLGPLLILFHANFQLGSLNSSVALAAMVLVASSGVIGRFLYPRIHYGLTGQRATLKEQRAKVELQRRELESRANSETELAPRLRELEAIALAQAGVLRLSARAIAMRRSAARFARAGEPPEILAHAEAVEGVLRFRVYERLFGLWHAFHMPLCFLLFVAALVHVLAVHLY